MTKPIFKPFCEDCGQEMPIVHEHRAFVVLACPHMIHVHIIDQKLNDEAAQLEQLKALIQTFNARGGNA